MEISFEMANILRLEFKRYLVQQILNIQRTIYFQSQDQLDINPLFKLIINYKLEMDKTQSLSQILQEKDTIFNSNLPNDAIKLKLSLIQILQQFQNDCVASFNQRNMMQRLRSSFQLLIRFISSPPNCHQLEYFQFLKLFNLYIRIVPQRLYYCIHFDKKLLALILYQSSSLLKKSSLLSQAQITNITEHQIYPLIKFILNLMYLYRKDNRKLFTKIQKLSLKHFILQFINSPLVFNLFNFVGQNNVFCIKTFATLIVYISSKCRNSNRSKFTKFIIKNISKISEKFTFYQILYALNNLDKICDITQQQIKKSNIVEQLHKFWQFNDHRTEIVLHKFINNLILSNPNLIFQFDLNSTFQNYLKRSIRPNKEHELILSSLMRMKAQSNSNEELMNILINNFHQSSFSCQQLITLFEYCSVDTLIRIFQNRIEDRLFCLLNQEASLQMQACRFGQFILIIETIQNICKKFSLNSLYEMLLVRIQDRYFRGAYKNYSDYTFEELKKLFWKLKL